MKLYIQSVSSYRSDRDAIEIKKELKKRYALDTRRQDEFIHLAVYGAQKLKETIELHADDELYITSGVGNIGVLEKINIYVNENGECIRPFDFINMLGNTTSYYVASSLGINGKNIFQISDNFTFINSLISIYASISRSQRDAILGSVDMASSQDEAIKRVLGIGADYEVVSSANYQKLSLKSENSVAEIEFDTKRYTREEVEERIGKTDIKVAASMRCQDIEAMHESRFFETSASDVINRAVREREPLIYIDCFDREYMIVTLRVMP